jgi:hypothetical protein
MACDVKYYLKNKLNITCCEAQKKKAKKKRKMRQMFLKFENRVQYFFRQKQRFKKYYTVLYIFIYINLDEGTYTTQVKYKTTAACEKCQNFQGSNSLM